FAFQDRTIFTFYAVVFAPFLVLGVTLVLGLVLGPPEADPRRRRVGALLGGAYVLAVILDFLWLAPVYLAETLPYGQWLARMWLRTWV
ncbi:MAG: phospholipid carrier-dependent glycosyltransferase, partial [Actinomycetota bacterium]